MPPTLSFACRCRRHAAARRFRRRRSISAPFLRQRCQPPAYAARRPLAFAAELHGHTLAAAMPPPPAFD